MNYNELNIEANKGIGWNGWNSFDCSLIGSSFDCSLIGSSFDCSLIGSSLYVSVSAKTGNDVDLIPSIFLSNINTVENDDDLGLNWETSNLGKKVINNVADSSNGMNTFGVDLKSKFPSNLDHSVNADSDSEMNEVYDETASVMAQMGSKINNVANTSSGVRNKSLYERWKKTYDENPYDDDDCGLTEAQMALLSAFDISLCVQLR
nr:hypothetical protein [Tanacetum cinerariifolium]